MTYKLTNTSQPADPYYGAVSLLLHGDDLLDSSLNPKTLTAYGDAAVSTAQSKFNGASLAFDGSGDYIATPDSEDFYLPDDFTIEGWVYPTSSSGIRVIVAQWREQGGSDRNFSLRSDDGIFYMNRAGTNRSVTLGAFSLNQWTHFAVAVENGTCYGFINGVLQDSNSNFTAAANNSTQPLGIGAYGNGDYVFEGYIDEFRITKGVARYTSNFTPPTQPFFGAINLDQDRYFYATSLLLKGDGTNGSTTIVDSSFNPKTITVNGDAQISTAQSKFGGASIALDGSGDYLTTQANSAFEFGSGDFTFECWIYLNSLSANRGIYYYGNSNTNRLQILVKTDGSFSFYAEIGASFVDAASSAGAITVNSWTHVAGVRNGTNWLCFVNGTLESTQTTSLSMPAGQTPNIGFAVTQNTSRYLDGYIDDLRITKGAARYTSNFTPPGPAPTY